MIKKINKKHKRYLHRFSFAQTLPFLILALLFLLCACTSKDSSVQQGGTADVIPKSRQAVQSAELQFSPPKNGDLLAVIETDKGTITAILYEEFAPLAVENFIQLANSAYYEGCEFFRLERGFVIQTGDPENTGYGGQSIWGEGFNIEAVSALKHYAGALCMAAGEYDTLDENRQGRLFNGSQFYIVQAYPTLITDAVENALVQAGESSAVVDAYKQAGGLPYLDGSDTVFGQVIDGMDIVDNIAAGTLNEEGSPKKPVKIISISIQTAAEEISN